MRQSGQAVHVAILERQGDDHQFEYPHVMNGQRLDFRIGGEQPDEQGRPGEREDKHQECICRCGRLDAKDTFFHPFGIARSIVVADHSLASSGNAAHGIHHKQMIALDDGRAGNEDVSGFRPSVPLQHGIQNDHHDTVGGDDQKR